MNKYLSEQSTNNDTVSFDYPQIHINLAGTNPFIYISPNYIHVSLVNNTTNILTYTIDNVIPIQYVATDIFIISKYNNIPASVAQNSNLNDVKGELIIKHSIKSNNPHNYPTTIFSGFFLQNGGGSRVNETSIDKIIKTFSNSFSSTTINLNMDIDKSSPYICANVKNNIPTMFLFINPIQLKNNIVISNITKYDNTNNILYINRITDVAVHNDMNINNIYIKPDSKQSITHVIENFIEGNTPAPATTQSTPTSPTLIDDDNSYITCYPVDDTSNKPIQNVYTVMGTGKTLNDLYASNTMNLISYFLLFLIILGFDLFLVPIFFTYLVNSGEPTGSGQSTESTASGTIAAINSIIVISSFLFFIIIFTFLIVGYLIKSIKLTIAGIMFIIIYTITLIVLYNNWSKIKMDFKKYDTIADGYWYFKLGEIVKIVSKI
jgi:hypothetical protein